jgi:hypothetical protein
MKPYHPPFKPAGICELMDVKSLMDLGYGYCMFCLVICLYGNCDVKVLLVSLRRKYYWRWSPPNKVQSICTAVIWFAFPLLTLIQPYRPSPSIAFRNVGFGVIFQAPRHRRACEAVISGCCYSLGLLGLSPNPVMLCFQTPTSTPRIFFRQLPY